MEPPHLTNSDTFLVIITHPRCNDRRMKELLVIAPSRCSKLKLISRARHERGRTAGIVKGKAVVSKAVESEIWVSFADGAHPFSRPIN